MALLGNLAPDFDDPRGWYKASRKVTWNKEANEAFLEAGRGGRMPTHFSALSMKPTTTATQSTVIPSSVWTHHKPELAAPVVSSKESPGLMDVDKARASLTCFFCYQSGHLAYDCPQAFDIRTMTPKEILGLLPELLTLANSMEIPNSPIDPEGLVRDGEREALYLKELAEEHFGNHSG